MLNRCLMDVEWVLVENNPWRRVFTSTRVGEHERLDFTVPAPVMCMVVFHQSELPSLPLIEILLEADEGTTNHLGVPQLGKGIG